MTRLSIIGLFLCQIDGLRELLFAIRVQDVDQRSIAISFQARLDVTR